MVQEIAMPPAIPPMALRPDELAPVLRIGVKTAYELVRSGKIRSVPVGVTGRSRIVPVTEIQAYLEREMEAAS